MKRRMIGVLGGMGPLATVDFMRKVIEGTPATCDQDHVPMIVYSVPQVPDRVSAILEGRDDPFPNLLEGVQTLERAGVELIVMPCNSAHAWFDRLAASTRVPMLHMAEAARQSLTNLAHQPRRIALLGTRGTLRMGIYQRVLAGKGREIVVPDDRVQQHLTDAIAAVKRNDVAKAERTAMLATSALAEHGCDSLLLACTELPVAIRSDNAPLPVIDATASLAAACVVFSLSAAHSDSPRALAS